MIEIGTRTAKIGCSTKTGRHLNRRIKKASRHTNQNEGLIFEKSSPGKRAFELPPLDVPNIDPAEALGENYRGEGVAGFPEVSEIEVIRHFTRLSTWNYAIDLGMYPLGSCTMKYNPRVNEFVARLDGIATEHPYQPQELSQGCLKILRLLEQCLLEITGMDTITLQPAAGAHGELTGLLLIRAYLQKQGNPRKKVLIPDSRTARIQPLRLSRATKLKTSSRNRMGRLTSTSFANWSRRTSPR